MLNETSTDRRGFLKSSLGAAAAFQALGLLGAERAWAQPGAGGYGPISPKPDLRDGVMRLALPKGFDYRSFSVSGDIMTDGVPVPLAHDGMAVFNSPEGRFRLVRNHEDRNNPGAGSVPVGPGAYDVSGGGTTTLVVNPFTRNVESHWVSLSGTTVNCAGGPTPWGSWLTCEETNVGPSAGGWTKQHGYVFEVPSAANTRVNAVPLTAMGRFAHEAIAVDPASGDVFETEDNGSTSGFYRFVPTIPGNLAMGGQLYMLAITGAPNYDTRTGQTAGLSLPVTWVPIANPNPAGTSSTAVWSQGFALGGARFRRGEGCWWAGGSIFFDCTEGGNVLAGQIWEYDIAAATLTLVYESPSPAVLYMPDNLTVSPQGAILLCEDNVGSSQYLRGLTVNGTIFDFALNIQTDREWTGACFGVAPLSWNKPHIKGPYKDLKTPDQRVCLFVNRQGATNGVSPVRGDEGMTFAIWGPWSSGAF